MPRYFWKGIPQNLQVPTVFLIHYPKAAPGNVDR